MTHRERIKDNVNVKSYSYLASCPQTQPRLHIPHQKPGLIDQHKITSKQTRLHLEKPEGKNSK